MVKFKFRQNKPVFQNKAVLDCISDLQEKFSVVSIQFCECLKLKTPKEHKSLPSVYWMPMLYYTPF